MDIIRIISNCDEEIVERSSNVFYIWDIANYEMSEYKICQRCIMDTTSDPNLVLDEKGICNYCHSYDAAVERNKQNIADGEQQLEELFNKMKRDGHGKQYDCLLGISGGVDSSYMAYLAHKHGLRVLAVHVDAGWNSDLAVSNIKKICKKLQLDLKTITVDWETMKELQRAYMFSGLANLDVPQDHAFIVGCNQMAKKYGIRYILNGNNLATEGILSNAFQYTARDWVSIKGVYKKCGRARMSLKKYPHQSLWEMYVLDTMFYKVDVVNPLNYIEYSKKMAMEVLEKEFDWKYYGGKHFESHFTKFFQEIYLPEKYGWDKRRDHISSLIVGGEMSREEGLEEISIPALSDAQKEEVLKYVLSRLDISDEEWQKILRIPNMTEEDYPNRKKMLPKYYFLQTFIKYSKPAKFIRKIKKSFEK